MPSSSVHYQILESVQAAIQDLNLSGIDDADVNIFKDTQVKRIERLEIGTPGIGIMHGGESEQYGGPESTNAREEVGYPVLVIIFDVDRPNDEPDQTYLHDTRLYWRQQIAMRFVGKSLSASPQVCRCTVSSRPIFLPQEWRERSVWISPILLTFWARVTR